MTTVLYTSLLGLGGLALVAVPLAVLTFPLWESPLHRWLDGRRRARETRCPRQALRISR
jgi:hypothetical protein